MNRLGITPRTAMLSHFFSPYGLLFEVYESMRRAIPQIWPVRSQEAQSHCPSLGLHLPNGVGHLTLFHFTDIQCWDPTL